MATEAQAAAAANTNADGTPAEGTPVEAPAEGAAPEGNEAKPNAAEATPAEATPAPTPESVVPAEYKLNLPTDSLLETSAVDEIATLSREQGLSNEAAQKLVDRESGAVQEYHDAQLKMVEDVRKEWGDTAAADPEIGGDKFTENVELAKRVIDRFGSDDLKTSLDDTGFGQHPEVVRIFVNIGKAMAEDQLVLPKDHQGGGNEGKSDADMLYGGAAPKAS